MLIDSHCHLDLDSLSGDLDGVMARAEAAGVTRFLTIGTRLSAFSGVRAIAERYAPVVCSVGVHPHEAAAEAGIDTARLVTEAQHPKVVAFGETGLDYYYDSAAPDAQAHSFRVHIEAAQQAGLPLIVHTRDADEDTEAMLAAAMREKPITGVLHCFTSGPRLADAAIEMGFYISFSGILTFKNAAPLREIAARLPLERILVETDAPYLAPVPMRGKSNEPSFVVHTARALAGLRGITLEELAEATSANFLRLFPKAALHAA